MNEGPSESQEKETTPAGGTPSEPPGAPLPLPRKFKYSKGSESLAVKEPFAYQAARIALWAPFVAIGLGFASAALFNHHSTEPGGVGATGGEETRRDETLIIFGMNSLLLLLSLVMGSVALLASRRLGRKRLVVGSLVGMFLSAAFLGLAGYEVYYAKTLPARLTDRATSMAAGEWDVTVRSKTEMAHIHLSLQAGGVGHWKVDGPHPLDLSGHWRVVVVRLNLPLVLELKFDPSADPAVHLQGGRWEMTLAGGQMTLVSKSEDGRLTKLVFVKK